MKKYFWILLAIIAMMVVAGCTKKKTPDDIGKAFATADAATKGNWDKAIAAYKTNDYTGAITILQVLRIQPNLTPEQWNAAQETFSMVMSKAMEAAGRGDANAQQAMEILKQLRGR
jgi:hypothetical protein